MVVCILLVGMGVFFFHSTSSKITSKKVILSWGKKIDSPTSKEIIKKKDLSKKMVLPKKSMITSPKNRYTQQMAKEYIAVTLFISSNSDAKCLRRLEAFIQAYPSSEHDSAVRNLIQYYGRKINQKIKISKDQNLMRMKSQKKKILQYFDSTITKKMKQKKYVSVLKQLQNYLRRFPSITELKKKTLVVEIKILQELREDQKTILLQRKGMSINARILLSSQIFQNILGSENLYKKFMKYGSVSFQKELYKLNQSLQKEKLLLEIELKKDQILEYLRGWDFKNAIQKMNLLFQDSKYKNLQKEFLPFQKLVKKIHLQYERLLQKLEEFRKKKKKIFLKSEKKSYFRIYELNFLADLVHIKWYGKKNSQEEFIYLLDFLRILKKSVLPSAFQKELETFGVLFLISGHLKTKNLSIDEPYQWLLEKEKFNISKNQASRLAIRGKKYYENKEYKSAFEMIKKIRTNFKQSRYFKKNKSNLVKLFALIVKKYYSQERMNAFVQAPIIPSKKNLHKIIYDFSRGGQKFIKDWKAVQSPNFLLNSEISLSKKFILMRGKIQFPLPFQDSIQIKIYFRTKGYKKKPANICVIFSEKNGTQPYWFLGIWFKIPQNKKIFTGRNRHGDVYWKTFPANGILFVSPKRKIKGIFISNRPKIYTPGRYRALFYHIGNKIGAKLHGQTIMSRIEKKEKDSRGLISIYSGNKSLKIYKISILGRIDQKSLENKIQKSILQEIQNFQKNRKGNK